MAFMRNGGAITSDSAIGIKLNVNAVVVTIFLNTSGNAFINALLESKISMLGHIVMLFGKSVIIAIISACYLQAQIIRDTIFVHDLT